jgi:hypothetical protein
MITSVKSAIWTDKSMLYLVGIIFKSPNDGRNLSKKRACDLAIAV